MVNGISEKRPLVSVVMPCLNEEEGIGFCIEQIRKVFKDNGIDGEIVICDNGSTDNSVKIANKYGARVVHEHIRGYGRAYLKGFANANGEYLFMVDADGTYDLNELPRFLTKLIDEKYDFVTGSRYLGGFEYRSMPFLHRYIGNPVLTAILNCLFMAGYTDVFCGFRGFSRKSYESIKPASPGMEFNLELAINARLANLRIAEIPIFLHRRLGISKLRAFRDGWRSLFMMISLWIRHVSHASGPAT